MRVAGFAGTPWLSLSLVAFMLNQASINMIRPMVSYRALALGVEPVNLGLLSAAFSITPLLMAFWMGRMIDRRGELVFILSGTIMMAAAGFGLALVESSEWILLLFAFFTLLGLGQMATGVATQAMIARASDEATYDRRFSAFSFFASIGQMVGPALGGLVAGEGSPVEITRALTVGGAISLLILPLLALIRSPDAARPLAALRAGAGGSSLASILRTPGVLRAILVSTTVLSSIDIIIIYLPALGEERHWAVSFVGGLLAVRAGASMTMRLVLGSLAARFGRRILLIVSMTVSAVALVALPLVSAPPLIVMAMIAAGAGLGIGQPLTMSWVASAAPSEARATALSVRVMGNGAGQIALPVAAGTMAAVAGAGGVLAITGLIVAVSLVAVSGGLAKRPERSRQSPGDPNP